MQSIQLHKFNTTVGLAIVLATTLFSCAKFNDWDTDESTSRLFSPTTFEASVDGVTVGLKWKSMPSTSSYVIEISQDSLEFAHIVYTYEGSFDLEDGNRIMAIPDQLAPNTQYSARVKGKSDNGTPESSWETVVFKTKTEQILEPFGNSDIRPRGVLLKWKTPNAVTHFLLNGNRYDISAGEKEAGEKLIEGLTPKTAYVAEIYNNDMIRGSLSFSTTADLPTGPGVVIVDADADLAALIAGAVDGNTFVLLEGTKYTADDAVVIPNGVSFTIWGEQGGTVPVMAFNGFTLPAIAGTIRFENLDITGYQDADPTKGKRSYIFNQSAATTTQEIIFVNCILRNIANSPLRLQGSNAITIDRVTIDNCIVYDMSFSSYAFISTNVATGKFNNISLTNNTFYSIGYGLILHNAAPSQTVAIRNNTFYNVVGDGRYLIDYNAQTISGGLILENNIIGKTYSPAGSARGIRMASGTSNTVLNSYQTADCIFTNNPISGIQNYSSNSTALFLDPDNGNFTIKDNSFDGRSSAGDPRWRQ